MGYYVPTHALSIPTSDFAREKKCVNPSDLPESITCTPTLHEYKLIYSSEADLGHRNHQGLDGFGCLTVFSCLFATGVFKYPRMHHLLESMVLMKRPTLTTLYLTKSVSKEDGKQLMLLPTNK